MVRKNPFMNIMSDPAPDDDGAILEYTNKGASKSLIHSLDDLAAKADRLMEGEVVVDLDPGIVDESFVRDRLEDDEEDFNGLLGAIRDRGQDTPILVRPHPKVPGRYMVVFGHRRLRAVKALGRNVRAVVKDLKDQDHLIAQGQENSARANLSFLEKALFAAEIARRQFDGDNAVALSALSIDRATFSKMMAVATIPKEVLNAVGAAKGIGRDRWYELKSLLERPSSLEQSIAYIQTDDFKARVGDDRFGALFAFVKALAKQSRPKAVRIRKWTSDDKSVFADIRGEGKRYTLSLNTKDAVGFGDFITDKLGDLYQAYRKTNPKGD